MMTSKRNKEKYGFYSFFFTINVASGGCGYLLKENWALFLFVQLDSPLM